MRMCLAEEPIETCALGIDRVCIQITDSLVEYH